MVSERETAVTGATSDGDCMDEVDVETMKVIQEQFLSINPTEIKEISEHSGQVNLFVLVVLSSAFVKCHLLRSNEGMYGRTNI